MASDPTPTWHPDGTRMSRRGALTRLGWLGAAAALPSGLLSACSTGPGQAGAPPAPSGGPPRRGGNFVMAINIDVPQLDPQNEQSLAMLQMYDAPMRRTATYGEQVPNFAESVDAAPGGLEYTLRLRKGMTFHDGAPFDAAAYVFALGRTAYADNPNHVGGPFGYWESLAGGFPGKVSAIEAVDPATVRLRLTEPIVDFPFVLADINPMAAINPAVITADPAGFGQNPLGAGTGPFKFAERVAGERVTLARHDGYWQPGKPYLDSWTLRVMPDPGARVLALLSGEIHLFDVTGPEIAQLQGDPRVQLGTVPPLFGSFLGFDHNDPIVGKKQVRQAVSQAIDMKAIVGQLSPFAKVTPNFGLFPGFPGFREDIAWYPYDPNASRQLLTAAGYPDGVDLTLSFSTPPIGINNVLLSQAIQGQLAEAGIRVTLAQIDPPTFFQSSFGAPGRRDYPFQMAINLVGSDGNAFAMVQQWTYTTNYAGFNPAYLELFGRAAGEAAEQARPGVYGDLQKMLYDDVAFVPLAHTEVVRAAAANLRGLETAAYYFTDVWFDQA